MRNQFLTLIVMLMTGSIASQNISISGIVTEASSGQPLPGVNVIIKNTAKGASTDFDGKFTLDDVPLNSIVVISYIGY